MAQRVWSEPARRDLGVDVHRIQAETILLQNVLLDDSHLAAMALMNRAASLSALIYDPETRAISSNCILHAHEGNVDWVVSLFSAAVAIQAAHAHQFINEFAKAFESAPAFSSHPKSGWRNEPDDMLNVIANVFAPIGQEQSRFVTEDFSDAENFLRDSPAIANSDKAGLTVEFPLSNGKSYKKNFIRNSFLGRILGRELPSALFEALADVPHPQLGSGLLMLLRLPVSFDLHETPKVCNELNLAASKEWPCNLMGAWCLSDPETPAFASFVPSLLRKKGFLTNLTVSQAMRAQWATEYLSSLCSTSEHPGRERNEEERR